ncbi:MAG: hypothetical protein PHD67_06085 [Oscillospiraceae bacterium]|nr:hypothetical protein [Oscillospiraceae bacterium]
MPFGKPLDAKEAASAVAVKDTSQRIPLQSKYPVFGLGVFLAGCPALKKKIAYYVRRGYN